MSQVKITAGNVSLPAELNNNPTAQKIWNMLPIEGKANIWGDEIYFEIPVVAAEEPYARTEVEVGELGYWPIGHAFCIFLGPTPVSTDNNKSKAYSPVNILGRVLGDATQFRDVPNGALVRVESAA